MEVLQGKNRVTTVLSIPEPPTPNTNYRMFSVVSAHHPCREYIRWTYGYKFHVAFSLSKGEVYKLASKAITKVKICSSRGGCKAKAQGQGRVRGALTSPLMLLQLLLKPPSDKFTLCGRGFSLPSPDLGYIENILPIQSSSYATIQFLNQRGLCSARLGTGMRLLAPLAHLHESRFYSAVLFIWTLYPPEDSLCFFQAFISGYFSMDDC